jgi:hypothetical protein
MTDQKGTYVWTPVHKSHKLIRAGIFPTYLGVLFIHKCEICGDVEVKIENKPRFGLGRLKKK